MTPVYTDAQACVVASVEGRPPHHRRTIPEWAAKDPVAAQKQRDVVRREVRAEVGPDLLITVRVVPGYCADCSS